MINIMRSKLGEKSLSQGIKDPGVLASTLKEMMRLQQIKKEEELLKDKRKKMFGMLLRAKRLREEEEERKKEEAEALQPGKFIIDKNGFS